MNLKVYYKRMAGRQTRMRLSYAIRGGDPAQRLQKRLAARYLWRAFRFFFGWMPHLFDILTLRKVFIPQIGVSITTRCTLKCRHCDHYIPSIEERYHETLSFEDYKALLDHLLEPVEQIFNLRIYGGEPLLNKAAGAMLEYALINPKIVYVELVTNGTILISEEIMSVLKRFPKKAAVYVSNYTANEALRPRLKSEAIVERLRAEGVMVTFSPGLKWSVTAPVKRYFRTKKENRRYFMECLKLTHCLHVRDGKLFVCPRAGTFSLRNMYERFFPPAPELQRDKEYVDLTEKVEKRQLLELLGNDFFHACDYCDNVGEVKGPQAIPALQQDEKN